MPLIRKIIGGIIHWDDTPYSDNGMAYEGMRDCLPSHHQSYDPWLIH